jgi:hypothetical protein
MISRAPFSAIPAEARQSVCVIALMAPARPLPKAPSSVGCAGGLSGETNMRQLFILFALVFALVTTATATVVTTAVISDTNQVRGG